MSTVLPATPLPELPSSHLCQVLSRSKARLQRRVRLSEGVELAVWANVDDEVRYCQPGHHTLSVYLAGGEGSQLKQRLGRCKRCNGRQRHLQARKGVRLQNRQRLQERPGGIRIGQTEECFTADFAGVKRGKAVVKAGALLGNGHVYRSVKEKGKGFPLPLLQD